MRAKRVSKTIVTVVVFSVMILFASAVQAQTTAFSYQGHLNNGGSPANGNYEMQFKLFDSLAGGAQVGSTVTNASVTVINGAFVTTLDFDAAPFDPGPARYLEISVRQAGTPNPFTLLSPRQTITSTPYAIQARNALTADNATNALQLGGVDAGEYVTTSSVGNAFIKNGTALQPTSNFNISGNGRIAGSLGIGIDPFAGVKLDVSGPVLVRSTGSGGNMQFANPSGETGMTISSAVGRADVRFDGTTLRMFAGAGTAIPQTGLIVNTLGNVATSGNLGVGTFAPDTRLTLHGGPSWTFQGWTASMNLRNTAAIGWDANNSGQRWGIGQQTGGLHFFRTLSSFGSTSSSAVYSMTITDTGNITQEPDKAGLVKAMIAVNANGTIARCYNGIANTSSGNCAFVITPPAAAQGIYEIDFGFPVNNRFVSVTAQQNSNLDNGVNIGTGYYSVGSNGIGVRTFITDVTFGSSRANNPFTIIIY